MLSTINSLRLNPAGHHFDSVLIHALNAVLLFLLLVVGYKARGTEPAGGGAVRRASAQCGVGGMGSGAKECSEHAVLFLGDRRLCVVRRKSRIGGDICWWQRCSPRD